MFLFTRALLPAVTPSWRASPVSILASLSPFHSTAIHPNTSFSAFRDAFSSIFEAGGGGRPQLQKKYNYSVAPAVVFFSATFPLRKLTTASQFTTPARPTTTNAPDAEPDPPDAEPDPPTLRHYRPLFITDTVTTSAKHTVSAFLVQSRVPPTSRAN